MQVSAPYEGRSDQDLAARARAGDREAFGALYQRYFQGIHDFTLRIVRDRDAAADVVQATFVKAWETFSRGGTLEHVKAWLYTVAQNGAIDELRRRKRLVAPVESRSGEEERPAFTAVDESRLSDPQTVVHDKDLVELVWSSAAALSPQEYSLLDLHLRQGLTADELAASLGLEKGAVWTRLSRLRDSLEESVTSTILMRRGRRDCSDLDALLAELGTAEPTREARRAIQAHLQECSRCPETKRRLVSPAEIFGGLAPLPLDPQLRDVVWERLPDLTAAAMDGAGQRGGVRRRWRRASKASRAMVVGAALAVAAGAGVAALLLSSGGGPSAPEPAPIVHDPRNVHSTSHRIGVPSTNPIVAVAWTRQPDASGYSISWSHTARARPDQTGDLPGSATETRSRRLPAGRWYFHLRTRGKNGRWTNTVDLGPLVIRAKPARLSRAQFIKQADAICATANKRLRAVPQPTDLAGVSAYVEKALPIARRQLAKLGRLKPPAADEATVDRMLNAVQRSTEVLEELAAAARNGDQAAVQDAIQKGNYWNQTAGQLARRLGLKVCGLSSTQGSP